jgi:hypothetical protein
MLLDNRTADGQPDAHPIVFRRVERVEQPVNALGVHPYARVSYGQTHLIGSLRLCPDHQLARPVVYLAHGVRRVPEQIEDDLLELNSITDNVREVVSEF